MNEKLAIWPKNFSRLIISLLIPHTAGLIGGLSLGTSIDRWYVLLSKPPFNPPNWIFGPVWVTLYTLMGVSMYLVWQSGIRKKQVRRALGVFGIQMALNALWSPIFFGLHNIGLAFLVIILMLISIFFTIKEFNKVDKTAANLLWPYFIWVGFATVLNGTLLILN